jgi:hypothetical protein
MLRRRTFENKHFQHHSYYGPQKERLYSLHVQQQLMVRGCLPLLLHKLMDITSQSSILRVALTRGSRRINSMPPTTAVQTRTRRSRNESKTAVAVVAVVVVVDTTNGYKMVS